MSLLQQAWASNCSVPGQPPGRARPWKRPSTRRGHRTSRKRARFHQFFKLLGGASESHHPSAPSQLYLAIASIFSLSVCRVKEFLKPNRPYINVQIGPTLAATLYDSGADISCISEQQFRKIPVDQRPQKIFQRVDPCFSTGGAELFVKGIVSLPISILG
jgi:Retroviral aspartyl protease